MSPEQLKTPHLFPSAVQKVLLTFIWSQLYYQKWIKKVQRMFWLFILVKNIGQHKVKEKRRVITNWRRQVQQDGSTTHSFTMWLIVSYITLQSTLGNLCIINCCFDMISLDYYYYYYYYNTLKIIHLWMTSIFQSYLQDNCTEKELLCCTGNS